MRRLVAITALLAQTSLAGAESKPIRPIPLPDFFRNPEKAAFRLSEDGQTTSFLAPYERRLNLFVQPCGSNLAKRITSSTDRDINDYLWKGSDRLLFAKDSGGDEYFHLFCVDRDGNQIKDITPFQKEHWSIVDPLPDDSNHILIATTANDRDTNAVYRLNIVTGEFVLVAENPGNVTEWITDNAGHVRVAMATEGLSQVLLYRKTETNSFERIIPIDFRDTLAPMGFAFDNHYLIAGSNLGRDKIEVVKFDPDMGTEWGVIAHHPEFDMGGIGYSRQRQVLTEAYYTSWKKDRVFLDRETATMYKRIKSKLANYEISSFDIHDRAEQTFIIYAYNDRTPGSEFLYEKRTGKLTKLADFAPWLREKDLARMEPITYKSRDGLTIHGYLTLPNNVRPRNLPVVVHPHGGPWNRDEWCFRSETQFLANRGYAVLEMNFRGSTGYGKKLWKASFNQWGRKMQDDITDGVQWLIKRGVADPRRIAIFGTSYGGYAALAGVTFTPELYACGVDVAGPANLVTYMENLPPDETPLRQMLYRMVGDPVEDRKLLEQASPLLHVDRVKVPMLIAHGSNDPHVSRSESDRIVEALRRRGIPVEYLIKDNEGHGFSNEENRIEFYEAMERFLAVHLHNQ